MLVTDSAHPRAARQPRRGRRARAIPLALGTALMAAAILASACGQTLTTRARTAAGVTVTFADQAGSVPTYILPLMSAADASDANLGPFQLLMYRPLYWSGAHGSPAIDGAESLADPPVYSNGGRTVSITLKRAVWSDGRPVTTRDVQFWMDLLRADPTAYWAYVPGQFPDNVVAMSYPTADRFTITFNRAYNHQFLLGDELTQIIPLPQHAWDRTSRTGSVGGWDRTARGARAVYHFLDAQSKQVGTYATDPLWQVVDGPWRLHGYEAATGYAVLTPNRRYQGPGRARIAALAEVPYTSDTAELDALRAGQLDYGYLPYEDVNQIAALRARGFSIHPWTTWAYNYIPINFANPVVGPAFAQLYVRQAMQHLVDQPAYITSLFHGLAYPDYTLLPSRPPSPLVSAAANRDPYPYSVGAAVALLTAHGWRRGPGGVQTCVRPGIGPTACGRGVRAGLRLSFGLEYADGIVSVGEEAQALRSAFVRAGIDLTLRPAPLATVFSDTFVPCDRHRQGSCAWALGYWGNGWNWSPEGYPDASQTFGVGGSVNSGYYSDPTAQRLLQATVTGSGLTPLRRLEVYLAQDVPVLWMPLSYYQLSVVTSRLRGTQPQDPFLNIYPEQWRWA